MLITAQLEICEVIPINEHWRYITSVKITPIPDQIIQASDQVTQASVQDPEVPKVSNFVSQVPDHGPQVSGQLSHVIVGQVAEISVQPTPASDQVTTTLGTVPEVSKASVVVSSIPDQVPQVAEKFSRVVGQVYEIPRQLKSDQASKIVNQITHILCGISEVSDETPHDSESIEQLPFSEQLRQVTSQFTDVSENLAPVSSQIPQVNSRVCRS